jgi:peptidyl-prolyl cis-trans isomerase SurA
VGQTIMNFIKAFLSAAMLCIPLYVAAAQQEQLLDKVVAVVDEDVVLLSQLQEETADIKQRLRERKIPIPAEDELKKQVLDRLIIQTLQLSEARRRGITVDDLMLNDAVRKIATQKKMTLEQFKRHLESQGDDYRKFREDLRNEMIITRLSQMAVSGRTVVTEQEIDDYLANMHGRNEDLEYLISHIQIAIPEAAGPEQIQTAATEADEIHKKLQAGTDFGQLAIAHSDGRQALEGGDLGWLKLSQMPGDFVKYISSLRINQFSKPFRTPQGFHILLLRDSKGIKRHVVNQVRARHILLKPNMLLTDQEARAKLANIRKQILNGADFGALAKQFSEDPGSAEKMGDLGWAAPNIFAPEFRQALAELQINKISEPFQTTYGWHIVQLLERRNYDHTPEYQREQAYQAIYTRKAVLEEDLWLRRLRSEAFVDYRL